MKIAALITARLGSTRLPRKHLLPVGGRPILQYLVDSLSTTFRAELASGVVVIAIATSEKEENRAFLSEIRGCDTFFGSDGNIPLRHLRAVRYFASDAALSVDGDDILCAPRAMRAVVDALLGGAQLAKTEGLPLGMNACGYSRTALEAAVRRVGDLDRMETGWGRAFDGIEPVTISMGQAPRDDLRFTLDYEEDLRFFTTLLADPDIAQGRLDGDEIVRRVDARGLGEITRPVVDAYWKNFHEALRLEKAREGS